MPRLLGYTAPHIHTCIQTFGKQFQETECVPGLKILANSSITSYNMVVPYIGNMKVRGFQGVIYTSSKICILSV